MKLYRKLFLSSFCLLPVVVLLNSCSSEFGGPNPQNYEDYVGSRDKQPAFSPDGKQIAYYHDSYEAIEPADYPSGLYIVNADGSNRIKVLSGHHYNPAWSPDGQWLVFSTQGVIQKCKVNGDSLTRFEGIEGETTSVEDGLFFPDWTGDGKYILFDKAANQSGESNLYSMEADFTHSQPIFGNTVAAGRDPELSTDKNRIVYMKASSDWRHWEIFVMDTTGTSDIRLTSNDDDDLGPTWSPDNQHIAWSNDVKIQVMNSDGSNQNLLSYGQYPSWSVDDVIVFSHANADYSKEVLYTIHPDGSNKTQITF